MVFKMIFKIIPLILSLLPIYNGERAERVKRIVGGSPAEPPPEDDPVVFTNFAGKSARVQGVRDLPHYVFRGIKYAHPPVGKERFLRPRQKFLEGIVNATIYPPPCIQPRPGTDIIIGDEDCLALNVFTPELPTGTEGLPVVVWIHGGGFRYGSASQYGVRHLVGKKLVVVTIQFRLGSLGFLSSGDKHMPGNVALWDMVLAVQWVRNYIGFFGGNPYRIFVMGHDSGASSAHMVALSNVAKGLPAGVIAMSGTAVSHWAMDHTPHNTAHDIAIQNGCPTGNTVIMVKCLQNVPAHSIIRGDSNIEFQRLHSRGFISGLSGDLGSAPVTEGYNDGRSLPGLVEGKPLTEMNKQNHAKIPLLAGICKDETKKAITGYMRNDITHKLNTIPNFLDEVLIKNLRGVLPISDTKDIINDTLGSLPLNLGNYMILEKQNLEIILDKVAEVTGDVLFNAPAFLTVERWSKNGAPTFLYSFEHLGKRFKGDAFLKGSPLVGNGTYDGENVNELVGHGDDLAYLFDVNDITGESITSSSNVTEDDYTVREIYTQMIADFVRYGTPRINKREVKPFSILTNNFIQIKAKPQLAENFKFCEMGMWLNIAERLKSSSCMLFDLLGSKVKNAAGLLVGGLGNTGVDTDIGRLDILGGSSDNQNLLGMIGSPGPIRNEPVSVRNPLNVLGGNTNRNQVISNNNLDLGGLFG